MSNYDHPMKKVRDYKKIAARIRSIAQKNRVLTLHDTGRIRGLPFYVLTTEFPSRTRLPRICISAGVHGNEPSGVHATLSILSQEDPWRRLAQRADFIIFPCTNPTGFERNTRENAQGKDLNRAYRSRRPPEEVRIMRRLLDGRRDDLSIELHEDVDSTGFYLYELIQRRVPRWGRSVIREVGRRYPINCDSEIDGLPAKGGIIDPQSFRKPFGRWVERRKNWPQALYQYAKGTRHCITFETPPRLPMPERVGMHLAALNAVLRYHFKKFPGFDSRPPR